MTPANPSARDGRNRRLELEYDYMGRRIRKVTYAWDDVAEDWETAPDMDLRFVYDGWNLVQEIDGLVEVESGVTDVAREYTWGLDLSGQSGNPSPAGIHGAGGIGGLLGTHWTSNTTSTSDDKAYIYFYDANGNVGQMIESTGSGAGTVAAKYEYYPFGGLLAIDGVAAEANPFRFSTKYRDNETGCYYYGYRYLRTKHGRWLSRDPIGEGGGDNLYAVLQNNLIDYIDSDGRQIWAGPLARWFAGQSKPTTQPKPPPETIDLCDSLGCEGCDPTTLPNDCNIRMKVNLFRGFTEASNMCGKYKLTKVESCNSNLKFTELFPWGNACDGIKNVDICKRVKDLADDKEHVVKCMKAAGKDKDGRPIIDEQGRPLFVEDKDKICCDKVTTKKLFQNPECCR